MIRTPSSSEAFEAGVVQLRHAWNAAVADYPQHAPLRVAGTFLSSALDSAVVALRAAATTPSLPRAPPSRAQLPVQVAAPAPPLAAAEQDGDSAAGENEFDDDQQAGEKRPGNKRSGAQKRKRKREAAGQRAQSEVADGQVGQQDDAAAAAHETPESAEGDELAAGVEVKELLPHELLVQLPQAALDELLGFTIERWFTQGRRFRAPQRRFSGYRSLSELQAVPQVQALCHQMHLPLASLGDWIVQSMEGDVAVNEDESGQVVLHRSFVKSEYVEQSIEAGKRFLATLPEDELLQEEMQLRDALLQFLRGWDRPHPAKVWNICASGSAAGNAVAFAKWSLIPRKVRIEDWISQRIGGDIELIDTTGGMAIQVPQNPVNF